MDHLTVTAVSPADNRAETAARVHAVWLWGRVCEPTQCAHHADTCRHGHISPGVDKRTHRPTQAHADTGVDAVVAFAPAELKLDAIRP